MCGVIIYSLTQIYALNGYKTALQPSHSISQLITVTAIHYMFAWGGMIKGLVIHLIQRRCFERNFVINKCMSANRKDTFCGFAKIKKGGRREKMFLVSIRAFSQMLGAMSSMRKRLSLVSLLSIIHSSVRNTGDEINSSHLPYIPEQRFMCKRNLNNHR